MYRFEFVTLIGLLLILSTSNSPGSEIFHWVDEDGVVTFSDWAPKNTNVEVSKLLVSNANPAGYDPTEDQNSVLEQAERMRTRWSELKEQKEERRKLRLEREMQQQVPQHVEYYYPEYYRSGYFFRPVRPPRPEHRPSFKIKKRQLFALDQLGLLGGTRPHSINSSAHHVRVNAGKSINGNFRPQRFVSGPKASAYSKR